MTAATPVSLPLIIRLRAGQRVGLAAAAGLVVFLVGASVWSVKLSTLLGWDVGASVYLLMAWALIARADAVMTRMRMRTQDPGAYVIFLVVVTSACASLVAIALLLGDVRGAPAAVHSSHLVLAVLALVLSWLMIQTLFGFHYARRYYAHPSEPDEVPRGLAFPGGKDPDFLDFAYYSFVVGMTSQVSDVAVTARHMRRLTLIHGVLSFVFNIAILAMSINIIAGAI